MFFDSHAHYNDDRFDIDRHNLLSDMPQNGVDYIVNAGGDIGTSIEGIKLAEQYPFFYAAVGVHPHEVEDTPEDTIDTLRKLANHKKVLAIGEIGLDYYYEHSPRHIQRVWFKRQMELAQELDLPIIVHSREAAQETFDMIKESGNQKGVIHCFSGSTELALEYVKLGFYIGVGGTVTFANARKIVEVVEKTPLSSIVIETDCPYLAPVPHRGKRNDSTYLNYIAQKIANIKSISMEEVARCTSDNAKKLYNLV